MSSNWIKLFAQPFFDFMEVKIYEKEKVCHPMRVTSLCPLSFERHTNQSLKKGAEKTWRLLSLKNNGRRRSLFIYPVCWFTLLEAHSQIISFKNENSKIYDRFFSQAKIVSFFLLRFFRANGSQLRYFAPHIKTIPLPTCRKSKITFLFVRNNLFYPLDFLTK